MNVIPRYADSTRQSEPSEAILLAEIQQLRTKCEIYEQALDEIANASDIPPAGLTFQNRCNHWRGIARSARIAAEGG